MTNLDEILDEFPATVQSRIRAVWAALPSEARKQLEEVIGELSPSLKVLKGLLPLVLDHYKAALGNKNKIAIVGPANVGKSTLYNHLIARRDDRAEVSSIPGTTRANQEADTGLFLVVDTPGADAVGAVGEREREIAFRAAADADFLVIVFEATRGIKQSEKSLFDDLVKLEKPCLVLLNKMDLIPKAERDQVLLVAARNLGLERSEVIDVVATEGENVGRVILAIAKSDVELVKAIAAALPEYRARLAWQRIAAAAGSAGAVGWIPLPFADMVPLLVIEAGLVLSVARIYGYEITLGRAKELVATFGAGLAARAVYQQLAKLAGVPGWILSAAIAAATTVAVGYSATMWFSVGEKPTRESLNKLTADIAAHLRQGLVTLGEKRPDRATLRQRIGQILQELPARLPARRSDEDDDQGDRPLGPSVLPLETEDSSPPAHG